ncbi:MAG: outer membrane beta-barrel protein [Candidatus Pseudobacter hemicellulosilyticus]|uniref:Outer membrane beta-barrel protein n=1 Tax=Candidatus Pseudobacter hemicellulosilyticus TaxID=3121375 RepID=A0AAJ6BHW7_9BACT|nr:MAG: outer membrane beta-barrel protein [Pseudobacter sp.]
MSLLYLLLTATLHAQKRPTGTLKGTVVDSLLRQPVEAATVSVFEVADSSLVGYALTNRRGEFLIKDVPLDADCEMLISFSDMHPYIRRFSVPADKKELNLGLIRLRSGYKQLEEVMVVGQRPPMLLKKDTLEFNAGSFKTAPDALLEDLLKQLPGVELDKDGNILVNGKKVNKITIDGKDFFGNDPLVALKNLPRNIIDKIQVADDKTKQNQFNKLTTGNEDKVINLTLKKDQKQGVFGRLMGALGSEERYEAGASLNFFDDKRQANFIANANNTNRSFGGGNFSISNAQSSFGGGSSGRTESKAAGLNFSNVFNPRLTMTGSYFYNSGAVSNTTRLQRENILPDTSFLYRSATSNGSNNRSQRVHTNMDFRPDSLTSMYLNAFYNNTSGTSASSNQASSLSMKGDTINTSANDVFSQTRNNGVGADLFMGRRLRKEGRGISLSLNMNYDKQNLEDRNIGKNEYFKTDGPNTADSINQRGIGNNLNQSIGISFSYSEPVSKALTLLFRYNYRSSNNRSDKVTNRYNALTGEYDIRDSLYSTAFRNNTETHNPDLNIVYSGKGKIRSNAGLGVQWLTQENFTVGKADLAQQYMSIFPSASFAYQLSRTSELGINYNGSNQQPSLQQLQPVPDNSNPLYVQLGNADLRPSFFHNVNISFRKASAQNYWYGSGSFSTTSNMIVNETYFDSVGRQVSRPLNVNGNYNMSANATYSKTWKISDWSLRWNATLAGNFSQNIVFTNKVRNNSKTYGLSSRTGMSVTYKELFTMMPAYNIQFSDTRYSIQDAADAQTINHQLTVDVFTNWPKRLIVENNIQYSYNSRIAPGFRKGVTMWNAAVNYQLFKKKQGILRFAVYDVLKQSTNVSRTVTQTYIQDMQTEVLQRYCLLSFIYNLRKFGSGL